MEPVNEDDTNKNCDEARRWMRVAFNRGRIYDCGRVPPLSKQMQRKIIARQHHQKETTESGDIRVGCFTLLSFLKTSHTNRRKHAFSESGWRRRIERGQISVDGAFVTDSDFVLSKAKQHIEYHRRPWREPILEVTVAPETKTDASKEDTNKKDSYNGNALKILYIDDHLLVVHKPSGLPTMPSQTYFEYSVLNALRRLYYDERDGQDKDEATYHENAILIDQQQQNEPKHCGKGTAGIATTTTAATVSHHNNSSSNTTTNDDNSNNKKNNDVRHHPTNVVATAPVRQLIRSHCSSQPQPVHRLGVGTSGVLVLATSLLGRQRLTDAIRLKSRSSNININSDSRSRSKIRKVYRALVYARRRNDRPGSTDQKSTEFETNSLSRTKDYDDLHAIIPDDFTIDCPIGLVPFPIGGDTIHAACPLDASESMYGHVHVHEHVDIKDRDLYENETKSGHHSASGDAAGDASRDVDSSIPKNAQKNTTKPAISHVKVLRRKSLENIKNTSTSSAGTLETALVEVEIPTGRPHQIRIHMAYAGYPLVGDPLYLPGGIPDTLPRNFQCRKKEEEDMETDDEDDGDDGNDGDDVTEDELKSARSIVAPSKTTTTTTTTTIKAYTKRVALPRDCGYHLHAHSITLEHPFCGRSPASNDGKSSITAAANPSISPATTMSFTAPSPPLLREGPSGSSLVGNR
jgi:23S rRNA-/tRNA-specific pseudouridylate synthase